MDTQIVKALEYAERMNNSGFCDIHNALELAAEYYYLDLTELNYIYFKWMVA